MEHGFRTVLPHLLKPTQPPHYILQRSRRETNQLRQIAKDFDARQSHDVPQLAVLEVD